MAYDRLPGEEPREDEFAPDLLAQSTEGGINAVLRSVGSLLVTLGGSQRPARRSRRGRPTPSTMPPPARADLPPPTRPEPPRFEGSIEPDDEIELVLADARERANRAIEDSVEQARQLLERRSAGVPAAEFERLGARIDGLSHEVGAFRGAIDGRLASVEQRVVEVERAVTGVYGRLDRIEALLTALNNEDRSTAASPAPSPRPRSSSEPRPRLAPPSIESREPAPGWQPAAPTAAPRSAPEAPAAPTAGWQPTPPSESRPVEQPPAPAPITSNPPQPQPPPESPPELRFDPAGGALVVRVFPISGFQGLMRVQDALARVPSVRAATVETYAQGEARLRLQLGASLTGADLANGIQTRLGQQAAVRASSVADRSVLIVLE